MKTLTLALAVSLWGVSLPPASAQHFAIDWHSIDCGGGTAAGGVFVLNGTIGQPDAVKASGGSFVLAGGFWPGAALPEANRLTVEPPRLGSGQLALAWADVAVAHKLQRASDLGLWDWTDVFAAPDYTNGQARVELPATGAAGFFRLSDADGAEDCVITITPNPVCVDAGQSVEVRVSALPVLGGSFTWSVGDATKARATAGGVRGNKATVEGLVAGTTTLTVTYALPNPPGGTCSASVEVTVK